MTPLAAGEGDPGWFSGGQLQLSAGISPLLALSEDCLAWSLYRPLAKAWSLEATLGAGYSFLYLVYQPRHWFNLAGSIGANLVLFADDSGASAHQLLAGLELYASVAPFAYWQLGPGLKLSWQYRPHAGRLLVRPVSIVLRPLLRPESTAYPWHFQVALQCALFGGGSE